MNPAPNPELPPPDAPAQISGGERAFDWLAYGGFAGAATFLLSLPLGYWARYSPSAKQAIHWTAGHLGKIGLSKHTAEDVVMTTALMQGGNIALLGVKGLEDKKPELVASFNRCLGEEAHTLEVEKEPKQTWRSLLKSRLLAWGMVFGSLRGAAHFAGKERFEQFEETFAKQMVCAPLNRPTHINGRETALFKIGRIGAIDLFASAAAATLLYTGSRVFAEKKQDVDPEKAPDALGTSVALVPAPQGYAARFKPALSHTETAAATGEPGIGLRP